MNIKKSLRNRFVFAFLLVIVPLVALLFYINLYGMNTVRTQVSQSNQNLLRVLVDQIDENLLIMDNYLLNIVANDAVLSMIDLYQYGSPEYIMAKYVLHDKLKADMSLFKQIDAIFVYISENDDFLSTEKLISGIDADARLQLLREMANVHSVSKWLLQSLGDERALVRMVTVDKNMYVGIWIDLDTILLPLQSLDFGETGAVVATVEEEVQAPAYGMDYLIVEAPSRQSDMRLAVIIPEEYILRPLLFFQGALYFIPFGAAILLLIYLMFIQRVLHKPLHEVIRGMRSLGKGDLETRVPDKYDGEFSFLTGMFNQMAGQISDLKIHVYEEKIRNQRAAYKYLQLQINPHFYMNSLNIINNLAVLKDYKLIIKMSVYLAEYSRFIMKSDRQLILLSQEIGHIGNYLEIHRLRYPGQFVYEIILPEAYSDCCLPPLLIQPFVENCMLHGFQTGEDFFFVEIRVGPDPDEPEAYYEVSIRDNGNGFPLPVIEQLRSEQYSEEFVEKHLGIWNVRYRIKLMYGDKAYVRFEQDPDVKGAVVRLRLPMGWQRDQLAGEEKSDVQHDRC